MLDNIWNNHELLSNIFQGSIVSIKEWKICSLWASYGGIHSIELIIKPFHNDKLTAEKMIQIII